MPSINVQSLTPEIRKLLAADAFARSTGTLTPHEIDLLTAAIRSDQVLATPLSRHRALSVLATMARPEDALPVLDQVARNPAVQTTDRIAALRGLGRLATPAAQNVLLEQVGDPDRRVQQAAIAALGEFANASALATLATLNEPGDVALRKQLVLAKALISHREGLDGPFLPEKQGAQHAPTAEGVISISLRVKSAEATSADAKRFRGSTYGIQLGQRAYELKCGRAVWTLFGNRDLGESIVAPERLLERPWIVGLLARWLPPATAAATQYIVLSRPSNGSIHVDVVRIDGELAYTGTATPVVSGLAFAIADVDRPQTAPTNLSGVLSLDGVQLEKATMFSTRVAGRQTEPIQPDRQ
jgi:hypothetical protein